MYAELEEPQLKIRFPITQLSLRRRAPEKPLTLRLLENGNCVKVFQFIDSVLEHDDLPLIFESRNDEWWFVSSSSCSITGELARIRVPEHFTVTDEAGAELTIGDDSGCWLNTSQSLTIQDDSSLIAVRLNQPSDQCARPQLQGNCIQHTSTPSTIFVGWPRLELPKENPDAQALQIYANGYRIGSSRFPVKAGQIRYCVKNALGETILQRRFGVLPEGFRLSIQPAQLNRPARLQIWPSTLSAHVIGSHFLTNTTKHDQFVVVELQSAVKDIPTGFSVAINDDTGAEPVVLHLPFPYQGARLIGPKGLPIDIKDLTLDELGGVRLFLTSGSQYNQRITVEMELVSPAQQRLVRYYFVDVGSLPVQLSLFSFQNDIGQMLGAVNDQDAYVRLSVVAEKRLTSLNVRRYDGQIRWLDKNTFEVVGNTTVDFRHGVRAAAMLLPEPQMAPIVIPERESEGIKTGVFLTIPDMDRNAPWLIYPDKGSAVKFRPALYVPESKYISASGGTHAPAHDVRTLHEAARNFHPQYQPRVIHEQIEAMAENLDHSGWQYLADLKAHYSHLPLSTFNSWLALADNAEALAVAVFRLEIDEAFCGRIRDELAVIWESTPLPLWSEVYQRFQQWLELKALPDVLRDSIKKNRKAVLPAVVSGFQYVDVYLETKNARCLKRAPIEAVLPAWYQTLRHTHESNSSWPTELGNELSDWIRRQDLPEKIKQLSLIEYTDAVTYLPIFMAFVTAGKAQFRELQVNSAYLKFAIKMVSDFDRGTWYACVHAMMVSYLLASDS